MGRRRGRRSPHPGPPALLVSPCAPPAAQPARGPRARQLTPLRSPALLQACPTPSGASSTSSWPRPSCCPPAPAPRSTPGCAASSVFFHGDLPAHCPAALTSRAAAAQGRVAASWRAATQGGRPARARARGLPSRSRPARPRARAPWTTSPHPRPACLPGPRHPWAQIGRVLSRKAAFSGMEAEPGADFFMGLLVSPGSPVAGKTIEQAGERRCVPAGTRASRRAAPARPPACGHLLCRTQPTPTAREHAADPPPTPSCPPAPPTHPARPAQPGWPVRHVGAAGRPAGARGGPRVPAGRRRRAVPVGCAARRALAGCPLAVLDVAEWARMHAAGREFVLAAGATGCACGARAPPSLAARIPPFACCCCRRAGMPVCRHRLPPTCRPPAPCRHPRQHRQAGGLGAHPLLGRARGGGLAGVSRPVQRGGLAAS